MSMPPVAFPLIPVIPVKALAEAKGRLAPVLNPIERRILTIAMFEDVLDAVRATEGLGRPVVISPDGEVWRRAEALGCQVVEEPPGGELNAALRLGAGAARARVARDAGTHDPHDGAVGLLVVAADLPLASAAALGRVRDRLAGGAAVVVVPSRDGAGTNVLGWRDAAAFAPEFGAGSSARHLAVPGAVRLDDEALALDVDGADDLRAALDSLDPGSVTGRRVRDLKLRARLDAGV